jgi:hypothetical protein
VSRQTNCVRQARSGRCMLVLCLPLGATVGILREGSCGLSASRRGVHRFVTSYHTSGYREQLAFLKLLLDRYLYLALSIGEAVPFLYSCLPVRPRRSSRPSLPSSSRDRCIQLPPPSFDTPKQPSLVPSHLIWKSRGIPSPWPPMEPPRRTRWQCSKRSSHRSGHSNRSTPNCPLQ